MEKLHKNAAYMFQHLAKAIEILIVSPEGIRGRLSHAAEHFVLIPVEVVPDHLKEMYLEIYNYLTEFKENPESSWPSNSDIIVTMKRRRSSTASKTAQKLWSFYHQYNDAITLSLCK